MGCLQVAFAILALILVVLFFYAAKAAIYGLLGTLVCGALGGIFGGKDGLQIGALVGFILGVLWAFIF